MVPSRNACFLPPFPPAYLPESLAPLFIQVFFEGNVSPDRLLSVVWTAERFPYTFRPSACSDPCSFRRSSQCEKEALK